MACKVLKQLHSFILLPETAQGSNSANTSYEKGHLFILILLSQKKYRFHHLPLKQQTLITLLDVKHHHHLANNKLHTI